MGTVTGLTADRMLEIEAGSIVDGEVDGSGHLILTKHDATTIDAGNVKGEQGDVGPSWALPGMMFRYGGNSAPTGFLLCDGSSLLRAGTYADLFTAIGTKYGSADGTHFYIPDNTGYRAKSNATLTIANATWREVSGYTSDTGYTSKTGKYYSYSAGFWTMITPGDYDVYTQVTFPTDTVGGRYIVAIFKNDVEMARNDIKMGTRSAPVVIPLSKVVRVAAGDVLETRVYQVTGASLDLSGSAPGHIFELRPRIGDIIKY